MADTMYNNNEQAFETNNRNDDVDVTKETRPSVTVLGTGDFGKALAKRLSLAGFDVVIGSRSPEQRSSCVALTKCQVLSVNDAVDRSHVIFFAIPRDGYDSMVTSLKGTSLRGKITVDVSNRTQASHDASSHAEYLASLLPEARVVRGFNVLSAWALENDIYGGSRLVYVCGDDSEAKKEVIEMARAMQFTAVDQGSLKMAATIENKPLELFPSWRVAMAMAGVLYLTVLLYFVLKHVVEKDGFTNFPLKRMSLVNGFSVIGILDMVYLPGCIAALLQLAYGTKYRRFPRWLDLWMKSRKQLGLIALVLAAMHGCMSTLYWSPEYKSRLYQKSSTKIGNVSVVEYKKMYAQGEAFLSLGVLALTSLCLLGVTSLPTVLNRMSWREWNFVQSGVGYFGLVCALLHFTVFAYDDILKWKPEVYFCPTVLVVIVGYITVLLRLVLFMPCLDNRVKKIRRGWERENVVVL